MTTVVLVERRGRQLHPVGGRLPEREHSRAVNLSHLLVHRDRLSIRQAQKVLLETWGIRRSVRSIHHDLNAYVCERCGPVVVDD